MTPAKTEQLRCYLRDHDRAYTVRPLTTYAVRLHEVPENELICQQAQCLINVWNRNHLRWRAIEKNDSLILFSCRFLPKHKRFVISPEGIDYLIDFDSLSHYDLQERVNRLRSFDDLAAAVSGLYAGQLLVLPSAG